jgi:hypothetical protein
MESDQFTIHFGFDETAEPFEMDFIRIDGVHNGSLSGIM